MWLQFYCSFLTLGDWIMINLNGALDKSFETKTLKELVSAPVSALAGVSDKDAKLLEEAFKIRTISDLARNKFFQTSQAICTLAEYEEKK
jgi:hypothetical protein